MLKHKHTIPQAGDIITIRVAGDEIIGEVLEVTEQQLILNRPLTLISTQQGVGFGPVTLLGDPEASVAYVVSHIQAYMTARQEIVDQYRQAVSGIQIAPAGSVVSAKS